MNNLLKCTMVAFATTGLAFGALAQSETITKSKDEKIIIRKKGDKKEKLTIVVDGDNVTVNGKPLSDLKDKDINVIINDDDELAALIPPRPPKPMHGGPQTFVRGININTQGNKAFLGVATEKTDDGAKVKEVTKESAADKAGLKTDDIITKIGDQKIEDGADLYKTVGKYKPEDKVTVTYKRDGKEKSTTATLGKNKNAGAFVWNNDNDVHFKFNGPESPDVFNFTLDSKPRLGLQVQETEDNNGLKVLDVDDESPAEKAGIKEDDILLQANGKALKSVDDLKAILKDVKEGDIVKLQYKRGDATQTTDVKFPKPLKTSDL